MEKNENDKNLLSNEEVRKLVLARLSVLSSDTSDQKYVSRPVEDPRAKPFMESSNQVMLSLLT